MGEINEIDDDLGMIASPLGGFKLKVSPIGLPFS